MNQENVCIHIIHLSASLRRKCFLHENPSQICTEHCIFHVALCFCLNPYPTLFLLSFFSLGEKAPKECLFYSFRHHELHYGIIYMCTYTCIHRCHCTFLKSTTTTLHIFLPTPHRFPPLLLLTLHRYLFMNKSRGHLLK